MISLDRIAAWVPRVGHPTANGTPQDAPSTADASGEIIHGEKTFYLFVQSFQSGSIAPKAEEDGTYTVTLEQGLGQTVYFADRPSRDAGALPTPRFLAGLGFGRENPPNGALVLETAPDETDIAVVELFNPTYAVGSHTAIYEARPLAGWREAAGFGLAAATGDLAALAPTFAAAHLFIDDCARQTVSCCALAEYWDPYQRPTWDAVAAPQCQPGDGVYRGEFRASFCFHHELGCAACADVYEGTPYDLQPEQIIDHWTHACNRTFGNGCIATGLGAEVGPDAASG